MSAVPTPTQLPPRMPRLRDGWRRRLCRSVLRLCGWSLVGDFPDLPKLVLIAAPHSSWWDGVWGLLIKVSIGADIHFMAKQELFRGPLGALLVKLGGMPINRGSAQGVVEQMIDQFHQREQLWLGIAPEGTRRHVPRWKSGFWRIAHDAGVPVFPVAFHYPDKTIHLGPPFDTTDDMDADMARLRAFYTPFQGKYHGV
ncbi:1-acyl-sn-glycerol-3-phosphate acyltransferase [Dyella agri]|uniref:1-acyl-sn-glycerol-3-phosphate acyltransferase n=1 Tax=Dyella agri TaxID=1926869 RepID=A0ABW8KDZ8_9GAMM